MEYNFVTNVENCYYGISQLIYYSHIPTGIISLLVGVFVFLKSRTLLSKILLSISLSFSLLLLFNLIVWIDKDSRMVMTAWSLIGVLNSFIFLLSFYFVYVFINRKDISFWIKIIFFVLILPLLIFVSSNHNLTMFSDIDCEAIEGNYYTKYYYALDFFIFLLILFYGIYKYIKDKTDFRKQILFLLLGIESFLISFLSASFLASYLAEKGIDYAFELEQYGLFGMTFFMGVLAYMIVRFKAFNIKMIGAQALVVTLFILIAAQFAFIKNPTNRILNAVTLVLILVFGYFLIRSVRKEVEQKEDLALANKEISERKDQLQKISDHLAVANAKLKELDTAKSEFVSIVAHQLQGPPTTVKGYTMLLSEGSYGEMNLEQKDILKKIFNANEQQIEFVNDLLNVSRMESGRVSFNFEMCNIEEICREVVDNVSIKARSRNLYLEYSKSTGEIPSVNVDRAKIREAITNLVDNAVKYTKKGGVTVSIKICEGVSPKCLDQKHIRIIVSDTGIGVPKEEMIHLFSKFSRGKDVKRLNAGGTGLGLYVVKMIVEGNKGYVWVESEGTDKGSKFIIELPFE